MPLSGQNKHDLFHDLNLTHHVSDVGFFAEYNLRNQQTIVVDSFGTPQPHTGIAAKYRIRNFELDRSNIWIAEEDSGQEDNFDNPIYVVKDPYEYFLAATASGSVFTSVKDDQDRQSSREFRGSRIYELNADGDGFEVSSEDFEFRDIDKFGNVGAWQAFSGTPPASVLTYSSAYTDAIATDHVNSKIAQESFGEWELIQLGIENITQDIFGSSSASIGLSVSKRETEYQVFINTPLSLSTEAQWYEAEYNNYENSTADSLELFDGGQMIQGGFVSGSGTFRGLIGYMNDLEDPDDLDSRVRFLATVSDLTTGEYQHQRNELLLSLDEVFELFARFESSGDEITLEMEAVRKPLSSPVTIGEDTFTAEIVYVKIPTGQSVDFLKVGQFNGDFSSIRLNHYWKSQKMILDVVFRVGSYESVIGSIPMTGGRLIDPVITGYRTEDEPEGFSMNMEFQQFEAAGPTSLTPTRKNFACVKAVPTGSTKVTETFQGFPENYDANDPESWNACEVRTLIPSWPQSATSIEKTPSINRAYAQIPTVRCTTTS